MRLWSLHPKYLDSKGLVAAWREALLARAVLRGETQGYTNHPQLERFKAHAEPVVAIDAFLAGLFEESLRRNYNFNRAKFEFLEAASIPVTVGQMQFELEHLAGKLAIRDPIRLETLPAAADAHPLFEVLPGPVESWERV
jgi:hypothetical protein